VDQYDIIAVIVGVMFTLRKLDTQSRNASQHPGVDPEDFLRWQRQGTAAYVPGNGIKARVKDPMILGVKCWAAGHLLANGTLADVVLFGSFLAWAVTWVASSMAYLKTPPTRADYLMVPVALFATILGASAVVRAVTRGGPPTTLALFALGGAAGIGVAALYVQLSFPREMTVKLAGDESIVSVHRLLMAEWGRELRFNLFLAAICSAIPATLGAAALLVHRHRSVG